jgi:hypothetical protein
MKIGIGNRNTRRKPALVPLCTPQIPHDLTLARNWAASVSLNSRYITLVARETDIACHLRHWLQRRSMTPAAWSRNDGAGTRLPTVTSRLGHAAFMANRVAQGRVFLEHFGFPRLCVFHMIPVQRSFFPLTLCRRDDDSAAE